MVDTLLLFDIDGTLIKESREVTASYLKAVRSCLGIETGCDHMSTSGKTDFLIFKEILKGAGVDITKITYPDLIEEYLVHLERSLEKNPGDILSGVRPLLDLLAGHDHIRLALGTGNIERGARIKLSAHSLEGYFEVGGFGSDAVERPRIIAAGIAKAQKHFRSRFRCIAVVGDTPFDIEAARENGVHSIAVATGPFDPRTLARQRPSVLLEDLTETEAFLSGVLRISGGG
jgi:phosphoglycolate phosphatase